MAYNQKNKLKRILDIQKIVITECVQGGRTKEWVFENMIYPQYKISRRSFYSYLDCSAGMQLQRIERAETLQLSMF